MGGTGARDNYRPIIDCLLNMPLLFWASEVTGNAVYREKAIAHIQTAVGCVIRPDRSTYHTYFFDPDTGRATGTVLPGAGDRHGGFTDAPTATARATTRDIWKCSGM